jgi:hypothetical protein
VRGRVALAPELGGAGQIEGREEVTGFGDPEAMVVEQADESTSAVAAEVAKGHVVRTEERLVSRHGDDEVAARAEPTGEALDERPIVLDVLHDVEREHQVERPVHVGDVGEVRGRGCFELGQDIG